MIILYVENFYAGKDKDLWNGYLADKCSSPEKIRISGKNNAHHTLCQHLFRVPPGMHGLVLKPG
jgi:hypothetical protein